MSLLWKAEELAQLEGTKAYQSLSDVDKRTINSVVANGVNSPEELMVYSNAITSVLVASREFSGSEIAVKEIFRAILNPRIKDIDYDTLKGKCTELIIWVHAQKGWEMDKNRTEMLQFTIDSFVATLKKYNTTLTIQELFIAFDFGYQKKYGDYFGFNNDTYLNWIREYTFCNERTKAVKAIADAKQNIINPPAEKLSPKEMNEKLKLGTIRIWKEVQSGREVFDAGNATYDFIDRLKLIPFDSKRKLEMMNIAQQELIDEQKTKLQLISADTVMNHKTIKGYIEELRKGVLTPTTKNPDNMTPHPSVIAHTKRLALKTYFKELIESKTDFIEMLDNAFEEFKKS